MHHHGVHEKSLLTDTFRCCICPVSLVCLVVVLALSLAVTDKLVAGAAVIVDVTSNRPRLLCRLVKASVVDRTGT